jgi:L-lactate utilization protein LutC
MSPRDEILERLRRKASKVEMPAPWQSQRDFPDLAERFTASLTAVRGEVRRTNALETALLEVGTILDEISAKTVVANNESPLSEAGLEERWQEREWHVVGQTPGDLRAFCARADAGLSGVEAALAETGSLVVHSGVGKSRLATLLPPVHIALVPVSCLEPDIFTWTASRNKEMSMPANLNLISGPSKSADIEFTLTLGVHGPKRLVAVLYE